MPITPTVLDFARFLAGSDPFVRCSCLLAAADIALASGDLPWALLDAAERIVSELRLEHGCEDWAAADWSQATTHEIGALHDTCLTLRQRARTLRDTATTARIAS